jgi:anti-anti-sigma factor
MVLMEAKIALMGTVTIVELEGRLDFETALPFRRTCFEHLIHRPVVLDLKKLSFVGSLGIADFIETIEGLFEKTAIGVKLCGVSSEFKRLFETSKISGLEFFESKTQALASFNMQL